MGNSCPQCDELLFSKNTVGKSKIFTSSQTTDNPPLLLRQKSRIATAVLKEYTTYGPQLNSKAKGTISLSDF